MKKAVERTARWGRALIVTGSLLGLGLGVAGCSESDRPLEPPVRFDGNIFGTFYQVTIMDPLTQGESLELEEGFKAELESVDQAMSTYRDDSELIAFNEAPLDEWQPLSNELIDVLAISQSVAEASHGAFDITVGDLVNLWSFGPGARPETVPSDDALSEELAQVGIDALEIDTQNMQARRTRDVFVDLSGVAKGHGTDRVAAYLEQQGLEHYLVNIGGELIARGLRDEEEQTPWQVGIEVPENGQQRAQHIIPLESMSVATSGDYRNYFEVDGQRFSHTIDPRTGRPVTHQLASVSVFHPSNAWADAWATALLVVGEQEAMQLAIENNLKVLLLVRDGEQWRSIASPEFVNYFGETLVNELGIEQRRAPATNSPATDSPAPADPSVIGE
ncbi:MULTISPECIES: FAD:protein FMN transferase [Halomonadaceae]|uniref:FAD:protein FMN transferase n=1 Tax=Vreelandella titanicae TaxID=664683 RepID=A0A653LUV0_9GAMM|nr:MULTISPECIES: FAD:protein FMN transferase [Halomonas]QKS26225.1 FAD:protein FMN transferase [Halomonas titanicae]TMU20413.1 FAD:protein FMN transferase [Halomonas sp. ATBC28]CAD5246750.1 FAD:protein FMN transferase [Halomonas sp. 156]CAD5266537.1 FAD:protein FMN transferase [Halomonas sp. 113]CAD5268615.1 FAD:protein FMN transferase [Halomonas sp. 59]